MRRCSGGDEKAARGVEAVGGGVAVAGLGVALRLAAQSNYDRFADEIAVLCGSSGCLPEEIPQSVRDRESRADTQSKLAVAAWIVGGASVAGGIAWAFHNYPRPAKNRPATRFAAYATSDRAVFTLLHRF